MSAIESVNIDRIKWCLRDRGITLEELASEVGMEPNKLDAVFRGDAKLSLSHLKRIAKFFNRGLLFFIAKSEVKEEKLRTAGFRTLNNEYPALAPEVKALMERVERQRQIFLSLREELGEEAQPTFRPPNVSRDDLKGAATVARRWLSLNGERSFTDYRKAVEATGILVFRSNGYIGPWQMPPDSEIAGFSVYHRQFPIIFVRKEDAPQRQLFTLAHELGHLILHGSGSVDNQGDLYSTTGKEREANAFAGSLLVPDKFLEEIATRNKPNSPARFEEWLSDPAGRWGVSVEVILRRLLDANRISQSEYRAYRHWKSEQKGPEGSGGFRGYRYREPVHIFGRTYVGTVLDALGARQLTATKASRYLDNIKIKDIHKLEREFNAL
jgi:Zn-dependent peptidase ImmA (M78 family)